MTFRKAWALALMGLAVAGPAGAGAVGLCSPGEEPVLSCPVEGGKVLSLCATGAGGPAAGLKLQYRFGRPGKPELVYPDRPASAKGRFFLSTTPFSGGGEERVRFRSGPYDYLVFQRDIAGAWNEDGTRDHYQDEGVAVEKDGKVVGVRLCLGPTENSGFPKMYDRLEREARDPIDRP
ncbi:hypothetical protein [Caulobacter mirabilis]|uniref:Uncharacterized protein n=1 Tax=Caulobacter mirabilis TaxID=69666 RepID=A0A2D2AWD3_9CAUL|nr:hypothetical protein [Caulobacter mirabilis]ATQ42319.1 hypothetical protein CSW64_07770 [Caulobacter mirabilis]